MLPDSRITSRVIEGDTTAPGLMRILRPGAMVIDMGSSDPAKTMRLAPLLADAGVTLVDAPVSGGAARARSGELAIMVGGDAAMVEAVGIAERLGLDTAILADVLNSSSGRNFATETKLRPFILPRHYAGGFALRLQAKDLALADGLQALAGVSAPQLHLCAGLWAQAAAALPPDADNTEIHRFVLGETVETTRTGAIP